MDLTIIVASLKIREAILIALTMLSSRGSGIWCYMNRIDDSLHHWRPNEELIRALSGKNVKFLVIGGLAVAWYCSERIADDMDILVDPAIKNAELLCEALDCLRLNRGYSAERFARLGVQAKFQQHFYAEILTPQVSWPEYDEILANSNEAKLYGIPIRVPSVSDLIRLKELAINSQPEDSDKHRTDIKLLSQHVM